MSASPVSLISPAQVAEVKRSWAMLAHDRYGVGERFYRRLFKLDPGLRPLFQGDLTEQGKRLSVMLDIAVCGLDNLAVLTPILSALGARHAKYGVNAEHYGTVGSALLWAVGSGLPQGFDAEAEAAWTAFYALVADTMQSTPAAP